MFAIRSKSGYVDERSKQRTTFGKIREQRSQAQTDVVCSKRGHERGREVVGGR